MGEEVGGVGREVGVFVVGVAVVGVEVVGVRVVGR